jgi:uncharacterized protein YaeQ
MATRSTVFKASLQVADIDHGYYADHALTLARHPSETDERMMVRLAALALQAHTLQTVCQGDAVLGFGAGLSDPDEPDVLLRDFTGRIRRWIEVGQPDDKALTKACGKADEVVLYCYGHAAEVWWRGIESRLTRRQRAAARRAGPAQHAVAGDRAGRRAAAGRRQHQRAGRADHLEVIRRGLPRRARRSG